MIEDELVWGKWSWRVCILIVSAVLVLGFVVPLVNIALNLRLNDRDKQVILSELEQEFPDIKFSAGGSYEARRIYLQALSELDEARLAELHDWLVEFKAQKGMSVQIWLIPKGGTAGDANTLKL